MHADRNAREDGRFSPEGRVPEIKFIGSERCVTFLGCTVVSTRVSAELIQPSEDKPFEGNLQISVEFSDKLAKKSNRSQKSIETEECQNYLEKCLKDSKCLLLESLCVIPEWKVWTIKLDIRILSLDGNLPECASIAAIAALKNFKTPAFSIEDSNGFTYKREPSPLPIHHIPLVVKVALFGDSFLLDPTAMEERNADGFLITAANECQEFCFFSCKSSVLSEEETFQKFQRIVMHRVLEVMQIIKRELHKRKRKNEPKVDDLYEKFLADNTELSMASWTCNQDEAILESSAPHREVIIEIEQNSKVPVGEPEPSKYLEVASGWGIQDDEEPCSEDESSSKAEDDYSNDERMELHQRDTPVKNSFRGSWLHGKCLPTNWFMQL